jgi:uncharacterized protein YutE (UPF0331/DUF86 family)
MKHNGVIQRKLALLDQHRQRLEQYLAGVTLADFAQDWSKRWMAERALQLMVEIVIDGVCWPVPPARSSAHPVTGRRAARRPRR